MFQLDIDEYYDERSLQTLGLDSGLLAQGCSEHLLRCCQVGRVRLYKGEWLQEWLHQVVQGDKGRPR